MLGANLLTMADQGKLGYIFTIYLATVVLNLSLIYQWSSVKAPFVESKEKYNIFLLNLQIISALFSSILVLLILKVLSIFSDWYLSAIICVFIFVFLFFQQLSDFARRSAYVFQTPKEALLNSLQLYPARILLLLIFRPSNILGFSFFLGLTSLLPALKLFVRYRHQIVYPKTFFIELNKHLREVKWLLLSSPFSFLWGNIPIFACGLILKMDALGFYTTINSITNVGNIGMELLETEFSAQVGKIAVQNHKQIKIIFNKILIFGSIAWVIVLGILFVFGRDIIQLVAGSAYSSGQRLLMVQWITIFFIFIFKVDTVWLRTLGETRAILNGLIIGSIVAIIVSAPLSIYLRLIGVSIAVTLSALSIGVYQRIKLWKKDSETGRIPTPTNYF